MIDDIIRMNQLLDLYRPLLTTKQIEAIELYYANDLSMSEIAIESDTSKAAVYDLIKRTSKLLESYEDKLHLLSLSQKRIDIIDKLLLIDNKEVNELANKLKEIEESED